MTAVLAPAVLSLTLVLLVQPQPPPDSDHDGLSDDLEQSLLAQFLPRFQVSASDCSHSPAEFVPGLPIPQVAAENGTIYGQVSPVKAPGSLGPAVEIHYYHLWKQDCGSHGHPLDAEHVSLLARAANPSSASGKWKAVYWFAAAHQNTVCDVSHLARSSTLDAEYHGASVWISSGKHASFLDAALCRRGCGNDSCDNTVPLRVSHIVNLGEVSEPLNGSAWITSPQWPVALRMASSDFPPAPVARLNALPLTGIAWFHSGRHPAQGVIARSSSTAEALRDSRDSTAGTLSLAGDATGNAVQKSYRKTVHALGNSAASVGRVLRSKSKPE